MQYYCDTKRHLVCEPYSLENLHKMAKDLGIAKDWFHNKKHPHYDIPKRRIEEISKKCNIVSSRRILEIIKNGQSISKLD